MGGLADLTLRRVPVGFCLAVAVAVVANVAIGAGVALGQRAGLVAVAIGVAPAAFVGLGMLVDRHRAVLAWAALSLPLTGLKILAEPLPLPGGTRVFATDILLLLAVGSWLGARLSGAVPSGRRLSPIFGWPLVLLAVTVASGVLIGHERYAASIIAQPFRMVIYAGIALSLLDAHAPDAWRAITRVFYVGAVIQTGYAAYYLAAGGSQTQSELLSTGGTRVLALSTAIYLTGSLVCALLNMELAQRPQRLFLHAAVAGLALFGIVISFGRATYTAVAVILPLLVLSRRYLRRTILLLLPLLAPVVVLVVLVASQAVPTLVPTFQSRITGTSSNDINVEWRDRARASALEGIEGQWLTGLGFGRISQFQIAGQTETIQGDPHNSYVFLLAGGGLLALGSFLLLGVVYVVDAARRWHRAAGVDAALVVWAVATWLAFMVNALAGPIFSDPNMMMTMWVLMTLPSIVRRSTAD